ncbi:MAG: alpha/beta hydrolase, partial [Ottowia sp.]|nr:alpha/beta hydrolase [Ottowia sp.]
MNHPPDIHARLTRAMRLLVERMAQAPHPPMHTLSAADAKATYAKSIGVLDVPKPDLARVEDLHIPARDGFQLRARLVAPSHDAGLPVLLYT